ncbi:MAG: hypothetical protein ACYTEO_17520 [Planctomycetota bacterium]|jgi:hypothetical protein
MKLIDISKHVATPAKILMTIVILLIALSFLQIFVGEMVREFLYTIYKQTNDQPSEEPSLAEQRINRIYHSDKVFLPDGTIHLVYAIGHKYYRTERDQRDKSIEEQIYDTNDNLLWEGSPKDRPYEYLSWTPYGGRDSFRQYHMNRIQRVAPELTQSLDIPVQHQEILLQTWRYCPRNDIFIGYSAKGKKIGYFGSTGFADSKSKAKPFGRFKNFIAWCPRNSYSPTLLWQTTRYIYQINFEKQQAKLILENPKEDNEQLFALTWGSFKSSTIDETAAKKCRPLVNCTTKGGRHYLIMQEPDQVVTVTIPQEWQKWVSNICRFTATKQSTYLYRHWIEFNKMPDYFLQRKLNRQWHYDYRTKPKKSWFELYRVDNHGNFNLLNRFGCTIPSKRQPAVRPGMKVRDYISGFSPPLYDLLLSMFGRWISLLAYNTQNMPVFNIIIRAIDHLRPSINILNWIISAIMMGFICLHGWPRRTSRAKFIFWMVFAGLFNLAGLLTYLALNHTVVIRCPSCGRRRGLTQVNCVRCRAELPAPERGKLDLILSAST